MKNIVSEIMSQKKQLNIEFWTQKDRQKDERVMLKKNMEVQRDRRQP